METTTSHDPTLAWSRVQCVSWVFYFHTMTAWVLVFSGIGALVSRIFPRFHFTHRIFGMVFMIVLYWCSASALVIHNTGLPRPILFFMMLLFIGTTVGYFAIQKHKQNLQELVDQRVDEHFASQLNSSGSGKKIGEESVSAVRRRILMDIVSNKTWKERFFSAKAVHGMAMAIAWYQMFGRAVVTNPFHNPGCWTYPAMKDQTGALQFLPEVDPHYGLQGKELVFSIGIAVPILTLVPAVGLLWSYLAARKIESRNNSLKDGLIL